MRTIDIIFLTAFATVFTYFIGATLASPVGQIAEVQAFTTSQPESFNDDPGTTPLADEAVTAYAVTQRARQEDQEEEDDDDDNSTSAPVEVSTKAPVIPPQRNESTILNEFNFAGQVLNPADVKPEVPKVPAVPVQNASPAEEDQDQATEASGTASEKSAVDASEDKDSDNEITQDEVVTTYKPSTFEAEYEYTVKNFNKNNRSEGILAGSDLLVKTSDGHLRTDIKLPISSVGKSNDSVTEQWEYSGQQLFDGEGRAGCECGKLPFKIPVSEESEINPNPWLAAIVRGGLFAGGRPHCAGTLVNNLYVLTSASCLDGLYPSSIQVWLTAHNSFEFNQASFGNIKVNVQEIIMHPNYDRRSKNNDLCLLKLSQAIDISSNSYFVPACLPAGSYNFAGTSARISGWSDGRAYKVCKADMPILDNQVCNRDTRHTGKITDNMVCAGYLTPTRVEKCVGDAGGPLVSPNGGRSTLVGVVSFGYEAKNNDYSPTVYSRVSEFSDWILHNTRDADWCGV